MAHLDEWQGLPIAFINQTSQITRGKERWTPETASAQIQLWATQDTLFLAARFKDESSLINPYKPVELWKGDSLELYLGFSGPLKRNALNRSLEFQLGIAPDCIEDRPVVFMFHKDREN